MIMPDPRAFAEEAEKAFQDAVRKALETHRRMGNPIAYVEDGKLIILDPECASRPATASRSRPGRAKARTVSPKSGWTT
ncbi:MAG: hypothetical protein A3K19_04290 [Lentisphaerae bacterium RIFOXYB12_FULL_65_16]|nr:MAG: hypothetical protein A3K19_04290 [Lentisphaerae bacterium RIFOXYB12_FULL_65_16]